MKKSTRKARKSVAADIDETTRFVSRIDRVSTSLERAGVTPTTLLPDLDVVLGIAQQEYATLNIEPVQAHQMILRNIVRIGLTKANPKASPDDHALIQKAVDDAFEATEQIAVRSGFFVGLAVASRFRPSRPSGSKGPRAMSPHKHR